jgi:hypothetical protein
MIYALLDRIDTVQPEHLSAALEVLRYCNDSVRFIFGNRLGDPMADRILDALLAAGVDGRTRSEINDLFGRNKSAEQIETALQILVSWGLARSQEEPTAGRPIEWWFATHP